MSFLRTRRFRSTTRANRARILAALLALAACQPRATADVEIREVGFDFEFRQILVEALIDGKGPIPVYLDSAASPSGLDESAAAELGITAVPARGNLAGLGPKRIPYSTTKLDSVSIAGLRVGGIDALVWDGSDLEAKGRAFHGILGENFIRRIWLQIDYPARKLRLAGSAPPTEGDGCHGGGQPIEADLSGAFVRLLDAEVEGHPITGLLDTGASGSLNLPLATALRLGFGERWESAERIQAHGANGPFEARLTTASEVRIGDLELRDVEVRIAQTYGGILFGNGLFEELMLTIDYRAGRICLAGGGAANP